MADDLQTPEPERASTRAPARRLADAAQQLAELARKLGHDELARTILEDATRRLDDGRVRAVVLGEIKHGKSSLINALLGEAALPIGVTPTTGAVVAVRVDESGETGTFLGDLAGTREAVDAELFEALARGQLDPDDNEAGKTPELLVDAARLPAKLELIDTPGFNDIARFRAAISRSELPRADVLVLVLDATQVLSRSELGLIRDAIAAVGGLGQSGARCFLVINRIDLVPEDERPRIVEHIRGELASVIPGELEPYPVDSKTALREPESEAPEVRAVATLRERLFALAGRGGEILPARARAAMLRQARLLGYNAAIEARAIGLEREEIRAEIEHVEQALAGRETDLGTLRARIVDAGKAIVTASEERRARFREDVEEAARAQIHKADIQTLSQVVPGAIQDAFLDFVHHESVRLRGELDELTREILTTHGELARRRLGAAMLPLGFRGPGLYVEPPAILIEVGTIALGVIGSLIWYLGNTMTGMVLTIASPLATVILREKTVRDARKQANEALPEALDGAITALGETTAVVIERCGEALDEHLMLADRALAEQLLDSLRRAEARLDEHEQRLQAARDQAKAEAAQAADEVEDEDATDVDAGADDDLTDAEAPAKAEATDEAEAPGEGEAAAEDAPLPPEAEARRLRERVEASAAAELRGLERELDRLVAELEAIELAEPAPAASPLDSLDDDGPKVIH